MLTIHTCYIFVVRFTFIDQQRTTNISDETGGRYDWRKVNWRSNVIGVVTPRTKFSTILYYDECQW